MVSATHVDVNHLRLLFSKVVNRASAQVAGNYSIAPALDVSAAALAVDGRTVLLTTGTPAASTPYQVTVSGVQDLVGNAIVSGSGDTASWTTPDTLGFLLAYPGSPGYESDGVAPDFAPPGSVFTFRVKYVHGDDTPAKFVKLLLYAPDGTPVPGSPFPMSVEGDSDWKAGVIFAKEVTLNARGRYSYAFQARDGLTTLRFPAGARLSGPTVNHPPILSWLGTPAYATDGVDPNLRKGSGSFVFAVRYSDGDGDAPAFVRARVWGPSGSELVGSPFALARLPEPGGFTWKTGARYSVRLSLADAGAYSYQFLTSDLRQDVAFPASPQSGPTIGSTSPGALTLSAATATPADRGAALTYTLSAPAEISASVFNLAGRLIADIPASAQDSGVRTLRWSGRNTTGALAPAGVYLIRLTARTEDGASAQAVVVVSLQR